MNNDNTVCHILLLTSVTPQYFYLVGNNGDVGDISSPNQQQEPNSNNKTPVSYTMDGSVFNYTIHNREGGVVAVHFIDFDLHEYSLIRVGLHATIFHICTGDIINLTIR